MKLGGYKHVRDQQNQKKEHTSKEKLEI